MVEHPRVLAAALRTRIFATALATTVIAFNALRRAAFAGAEAVLPVLAQRFGAPPQLFGLLAAAFATGTRNLLTEFEQLIEHPFTLPAAPATAFLLRNAFGRPALAGAEAVLPVLAQRFGAPPQLFGLFGTSFTSSAVDLLAQLEQPVEQTRFSLGRAPALLAAGSFEPPLSVTLPFLGTAVLSTCPVTLLLLGAAVLSTCPVTPLLLCAAVFVASPVTLLLLGTSVVVTTLVGTSTCVVVRFLRCEPKPADAQYQDE